jgi:hypothetical protein
MMKNIIAILSLTSAIARPGSLTAQRLAADSVVDRRAWIPGYIGHGMGDAPESVRQVSIGVSAAAAGGALRARVSARGWSVAAPHNTPGPILDDTIELELPAALTSTESSVDSVTFAVADSSRSIHVSVMWRTFDCSRSTMSPFGGWIVCVPGKLSAQSNAKRVVVRLEDDVHVLRVRGDDGPLVPVVRLPTANPPTGP